jgi:hypothetical protein
MKVKTMAWREANRERWRLFEKIKAGARAPALGIARRGAGIDGPRVERIGAAVVPRALWCGKENEYCPAHSRFAAA